MLNLTVIAVRLAEGTIDGPCGRSIKRRHAEHNSQQGFLMWTVFFHSIFSFLIAERETGLFPEWFYFLKILITH